MLRSGLLTSYLSCASTILSGIPSECQTVLIQIRPDFVGSDLDQNSLKRISAYARVGNFMEAEKIA